jgi:hypothetical protein
VALLIPFLRLGQWLFPASSMAFTRTEILTRVQTAPWHAVEQMGSLFGHAVLAWVITATPVLLVLTVALTPLMARVAGMVSEPRSAGD